jgi:uncharacterized membrane protein
MNISLSLKSNLHLEISFCTVYFIYFLFLFNIAISNSDQFYIVLSTYKAKESRELSL